MVLLYSCHYCCRQSAEAQGLQKQQQQGEASSQPSMEATISAEKRARRAAEEDAAKLLNRVKQLQKEEDKAKRRIHETRRKAQDVLRCLACVVCQSTATREHQHLPAALLAVCGLVSAGLVSAPGGCLQQCLDVRLLPSHHVCSQLSSPVVSNSCLQPVHPPFSHQQNLAARDAWPSGPMEPQTPPHCFMRPADPSSLILLDTISPLLQAA